MGRKGRDTRAKLIAAAEHLIRTRSLRDIGPTDIAREAGVPTPTFYVYFEDVGAALLAAIEPYRQSTPELLALIEQGWTPKTAPDSARAFVAHYLGFWENNFALLRAKTLASDEGDERFLTQKLADMKPLLQAITRMVADGQEAGHIPAHLLPGAVAGTVLSALERLAAAPRATPSFKEEGSKAAYIEAAAYMMTSTLGFAPTTSGPGD